MMHLILAAAVATVVIEDFKFRPAVLTVVAGQSVRFVNKDDEAHTVTATGGSFDSDGLDTNQRWTHTFRHPGRYTYICELHPYMKGTIVVTAARHAK
jgi:plastocyanin